MSDIQFETPGLGSSMPATAQSAEGKIEQWLVQKGVVSSASQARYVLIGIAIVAFFIAIGAWMTLSPSSRAPSGPDPSALQQQYVQQQGSASAAPPTQTSF